MDFLREVEYKPKQEDCGRQLGQYILALNTLETVRLKIPEEAESAPGRLLDRLQLLPSAIQGTLTPFDKRDVFIEASVTDAVKTLEEARSEMDKRQTRAIAKYLPYSLQAKLEENVVNMQRHIFEEAVRETAECMCAEVCGL